MYFLAYISRMTSKTNQKDLNNILEKAKQNNGQRGVTGMLLVRSGVFFQQLEGEKKEVLDIFQKIVKDKRHENIEILIETEIDGASRMFPNWHMGFIGEIQKNAEHERLVDTLHACVSSTKPKQEKIFALLKKFSTIQPTSAQEILGKAQLTS